MSIFLTYKVNLKKGRITKGWIFIKIMTQFLTQTNSDTKGLKL